MFLEIATLKKLGVHNVNIVSVARLTFDIYILIDVTDKWNVLPKVYPLYCKE
jgi:hypothetical protein